MHKVYLEVCPICNFFLKWMGFICLGGKFPIHSKLYWIKDGTCYMTELTSEKPKFDTEVVGVGDGYTIQITKVDKVSGLYVQDVDLDVMVTAIRNYAATHNGNLNDSTVERDWLDKPQGYGGPMYDNRYTSNTYVFWVLKQCCKATPEKPKGAFGWENMPKFPCPKKLPTL